MEETKPTKTSKFKSLNKTISITPKRFFACLILLAVIGTLGYVLMELKRLRHEIYWLQYNTYGWAWMDQNYDTSMDTSVDSGSTMYGDMYGEFTLLSQEVKDLEVVNPSYDYKDVDEEPEYETKKIRVLEVSVNNTTSTTQSIYGLSKVDKNGLVSASSVALKPGTEDYNRQLNTTSFTLIPGGKATIYLYFEDDGEEITKLYDSSFAQFIELKK